MTHDLVERLRGYRPANEWGDGVEHTICNEAADLIESLRADLAEQKAAHGDCIKRNIALAGENAAAIRNMGDRT